ncbi:MAG TPA: IS1 family transposase [Thermoanaerobaculia bacterium]|nr:IS1 family transposase [Thermoanaerobaculia bacterium]
MNKLSVEGRTRVLKALVEGNSINSTVRMTGVAHTTILRLIAEVGEACLRFHDAQVRNLSTTVVQADEVWSFCYSKEKNVPEQFRGRPGYGSIWTWTALDSISKLMISWVVSDRSQAAANALMFDLKSRISNRIQLSSDGLPQYVEAVFNAFRPGEIDHAEVIKVYASSKPGKDVSPNSAASRYSPGRLKSIEKRIAFGNPDEKLASTSHMERWNLTVRMQNRRFTRLTNGFSKKLENHAYMLAITMVYYNFCRKHKSLKGQTPAMAAGLTSYRWTASDLLALDMWANEAAA